MWNYGRHKLLINHPLLARITPYYIVHHNRALPPTINYPNREIRIITRIIRCLPFSKSFFQTSSRSNNWKAKYQSNNKIHWNTLSNYFYRVRIYFVRSINFKHDRRNGKIFVLHASSSRSGWSKKGNERLGGGREHWESELGAIRMISAERKRARGSRDFGVARWSGRGID